MSAESVSLDASSPLAAMREWHRGMSFGYMAPKGYYRSEAAHRHVERMAAAGVRWVALMVTVMQESYASTRLYHDYHRTASDDELMEMIGRIRGHGMHVMLKPIIECQDSAWRGRIQFPDGDQQIQGVVADYWSRWFESLQHCLRHYGRLSKETDVEMLCLGCEMVGTEGQTDHWRRTIAATREVYPGAITYNGDFRHSGRATTPWFEDLDLIGQSFYIPAADEPGASVEAMVRHLQPAVQKLREAAQVMGKPVYFAECGCRSRVGGATRPADYRPTTPYSGEEQANYLAAVLESFCNEPWWAGLYWWKWDELQRRPQYEAAGGDTGFTLDGKPAVEVLRHWYARSDGQ